MRCDCRYQLTESLTQIAERGRGVVFYLQQEGRGIGLSNKIRAYNLQDKGFDTVEANHQLGFKEDERGYGIVSDMINFLGIKTVDLMTNNPKKLKALEATSGKQLSKSDVIGWAMSDDISEDRDRSRIVYENNEIGVHHSFVTFKDGNTQAVMAVYKFKDGKIISLETGATNMPK